MKSETRMLIDGYKRKIGGIGQEISYWSIWDSKDYNQLKRLREELDKAVGRLLELKKEK